MVSKVHLGVNNKNNVTADERGKYKGQGGNFHEEQGLTIEWHDKSPQHGFYVEFYDIKNCMTNKGWPFEEPEPTGKKLPVSGSTAVITTLKGDLNGTFWKYTVTAADGPPATALDPIMIVRDMQPMFALAPGTFIAAGIGLLVGLTVATLVQKIRAPGRH
jgi:hypothetical protein